MSESSQAAMKHFKENRQLFGSSTPSPEKLNLYQGLALLAEAVDALDKRLSSIEGSIQKLRATPKRAKPRR